MAPQDHLPTTRPFPLPMRLDASAGLDQACIRVLSVDQHPLLREGIAAIINHQPDMALVAQASGGLEAIRQYREHRPDVTIMDVWLPDLGGIDALTAIRAEFPAARIIMLSSLEGDMEVRRALKAGARGYLLKNMPPGELIQAVREVHAGRKRVPPEVAAQLAEHVGDDTLTTREIEVLARLCDGNRNRDIGELLCISEETVKVHMKGILQKLGARDRTEAMAIAARRGIIRL
ncbi:MAG TPA: response regulator transcription factor [Bryobacteraceae bacterium]|nr:response regulator transcription factor [Bryobacteraceae bacterium]